MKSESMLINEHSEEAYRQYRIGVNNSVLTPARKFEQLDAITKKAFVSIAEDIVTGFAIPPVHFQGLMYSYIAMVLPNQGEEQKKERDNYESNESIINGWKAVANYYNKTFGPKE